MSAGDETPLGRWSRRKRAARKGGAARSAVAPPAALPEPDMRSAPVSQPPAETEPAEKDAPAPPPSLDDLTVENDLIGFLQKGIPEHLKNAALRKMWSLDPAIRDHIGLAENSWDFTRPETIPGFGPIAGSVAAPDFFSVPAPAAPPDPEAPVASVRAPETRIEQAPRATAAPPIEEPLPSRSEPAAEAEKDDTSETAKPGPASRHGGALPRE